MEAARIDVDELRGVLRERAALGDDDRHGIALVARLADGERIVRRRLDVLRHRPRARQAALPSSARSAPENAATTPSACSCGVDVHPHDARGGYGLRTTTMYRRRQRQVVDERARPAQERRVLLALDRRSHEARCCLGRGHDATPATDATALTMLWYPVQRQRLPSRPVTNRRLVGRPPLSMRLTAARTMPGVQ